MAIQNYTTTTTITTRSYTTTTGAPPELAPKRFQPSQEDSDFESECEHEHGGRGGSAIDNLPLPAWAKSLLKGLLGDSGNGGDSLPSSADAAKTIRDFQKEKGLDLLSSDQLQQMADPGYCKMPNGEFKQVPPEVQAAAQKMMENNGELFKKLESAIRGSHDGLLSAADYDAALKDGSIGKPGTSDLQTMHGLDRDAFLKHVMSGIISKNLPLEYNAAESIHNFQKENNIGLMNADQLQQMADPGYCKMPNGEYKQVPPDVQAAARKMMENNGELYKKLESAVTGKFDGLLSKEDFLKAAQDGKLGNQGANGAGSGSNTTTITIDFSTTDAGNGLPSSSDAAKSIRDFQKDNNIDLLNVDQLQQMAETGECTMPNGETKQVSPEMQAAAQKMLENNGALFKLLESAIRGSHDGLLSAADYDAALNDGSIGKPGTQDLPSANRAGPGSNTTTVTIDFSTTDAGNGLPSSSDAAKSIRDFQKDNNIDLLNVDQLQQMAETGECTMPNGETKEVSPEMQAAAQKMLENNGALFKLLESAIRGSHDGLLSAADYDAALKDGSIGKPGTADLARTGGPGLDNLFNDDAMIEELMQYIAALIGNGNSHLNDVDVDVDVDIDIDLTLNSANGPGNTGPASPNNGAPSTKSEFGAIDTLADFHKNVMGKDTLMTREQMQQIADTGKVTKKDGETVDVPPDVQDAAKRMMADGGAMFDRIESRKGGKDGKISDGDFKAAWKESIKDTTSTMIDFQKKEMGGDFLTRAHMKQMAETGTITKNDGSVVPVPPEVQEAARNYMDNDAKLFKEVESWQDNKHDDKLSVKDAERRAAAAA